MLGFLLSVIAGSAMSLQGVFNTRLSEKLGLWQANFIVMLIGFIITLLISLFSAHLNIKELKEVNKLYLVGGILGVIIIYAVMKSIKLMGTTCAISIILISQLTVAALIDAFGLFESTQMKFGLTKILGIALMTGGIIIFKLKC
jgi:bacterial/archaeal transporter family-2 protein